MSFLKAFSFGKKGREVVAVCDIGSGSVAVAIAEVCSDKDTPVRITASERRSLKLEERAEKQTVSQLKTLAQETAAAVLEAHSKKGGKPPMEVIAVVHAPWVHSETIHKNKRFEGALAIGEEHIRDLAKEAMRGESSLNQERVFERGVMRVALNGYPTKKPEGKMASRIDLWVLQSDIDPDAARAVQDALTPVFTGRTPQLFSTAFVLNIVIQEYMPAVAHYTLLDVTSIATSAFVVRDGAVVKHADAPIGWRTVLSELASIHGTTPTEALSRVKMVGEDLCTDQVCETVTASLSKVEPKFVEAYGTMFSGLLKEKKVPDFIMLIAPPDLSGWFASMLSRIDFAQFTISERPFIVRELYPEHLVRDTELASALPEDAGIAAAAGFMHIRIRDKEGKR